MLIQIATFFGYAASVLLAISLMMNSALKFRWINAFGGISFIIYGSILHIFPVVLTNSILLSINIYQLIQLYRIKEQFALVEIHDAKTNPIIHNFYETYKADVKAYFPNHKDAAKSKNLLSFVVMRDAVITNIFIADVLENGDALVHINYTVPKYRDFKVGHFIFDKEKSFLLSKGIKRIVYNQVAHPKHAQFLKVMGFEQLTENGKSYTIKSIV